MNSDDLISNSTDWHESEPICCTNKVDATKCICQVSGITNISILIYSICNVGDTNSYKWNSTDFKVVWFNLFQRFLDAMVTLPCKSSARSILRPFWAAAVKDIAYSLSHLTFCSKHRFITSNNRSSASCRESNASCADLPCSADEKPIFEKGYFYFTANTFFLFWCDLLEVLLHCICAVSTYSLYTLCCFLSYPCMEHAYNSFYNYIDRKWNTRKIWYLVSDIWIKIIATLYWYLNFSTAQHIINTIIVSQGFNISPLPVMVSLTITKCNRFKCLISLKLRTIHDLQHTCFIIFPLIIKAHAIPFLDKW